ncbi:palmitoyl protein thioesterase/ dolichol pyrophosphate phosphatase fusion protein Pdf1 [Schizosaccharomyces pombe]|uniref:Palmitoyl-protein thioesterase-dolichyl pyrophosphate phosphatase fusion 1 n=1 Tax=Schizosaccharomyces pombe (strain 972 / ATCC 24843) TaxID=284812 RepID=PDF1_SCHPO|nr:palmitoyl protein thioesterase-dolichol pyrophosphate phosphatase fusion 1 [Schizosaccharomyces pombe]O59747.2 RecName: Full=Palmitoyl-protein thioesterase-dolichyl pyrophosphate phosphatase fusion 1; Contains: RecName: Full=Palmitoyl-protein thioesterase; Short=PPT; AltName: Full=Palmitoyl-protein hydrolase; Contains: RecName: Full=Dolichyldiphosphatase; AltName: Full=Dolichyl pyrophosphate phosphatase; Flags: Precursor [Schizosaccharomyces pombe 972h-]CAA19178.2 palmitoyl protein thioesteras|eukprot:NP_595325.2 palmitoyl protein thioesterase-dolichol pyrophosphate phosphatase fusion 1 [Schizosaccharomyces pombe]
MLSCSSFLIFFLFSWVLLPMKSFAIPIISLDKVRLAINDGASEQLPVVIWHGLGDTPTSFTLTEVSQRVQKLTKGAVYAIRVGDNEFEDIKAGYLGKLEDQLDEVCDLIGNEDSLSNGFYALGLSQGGLFLRALAQTCDAAKIRSLITLGSPHSGINTIPGCSPTNLICKAVVHSILGLGIWHSWIQNHVVQAQYYRTEKQYDKYLENNKFLTHLNNEVLHDNYTRNIEKLKELDNLVAVSFERDDIVEPPYSTGFGWINETTGENIEMEDFVLYESLGLKDLVNQGKLETISFPGRHLQMRWGDFDALVLKYFKDEKEEKTELEESTRPSNFLSTYFVSPLVSAIDGTVDYLHGKSLFPEKRNFKELTMRKRSIVTPEDSEEVYPYISEFVAASNVSEEKGPKSFANLAFITIFSHFFYHIDDMWRSTLGLFSLIPQIIGIIYLTVMFTGRELDTFMQFGGQVVNEFINYVVKVSLKYPRPADIEYGVGYGMPSSHSQFMGFFSAYMIAWDYKYRRSQCFSMLSFAKYAIYLTLSTFVCSSRYLLDFHYLTQVVYGYMIGFGVGLFWVYLVGKLRSLGVTKWLLSLPPLQFFYIKDTIPHSKDNHKRQWLESKQFKNQKSN